MKSKINNPVLVYFAKNTWIVAYAMMFNMVLGEMLDLSIVWIKIAGIAFSVFIITLIVLSMIYYRPLSQSEQKAENDERAQMILGKASQLALSITMCVCLVITFVAAMILKNYYVALTALCIAFFNQLLVEILRAIFSRKY